jgi:hypothetical protein
MTLIFEQCPNELLDYTVNWATRGLGTDTIISQSYTQSSSDFTLSSQSLTPTTTTFWLTGGVPGNY